MMLLLPPSQCVAPAAPGTPVSQHRRQRSGSEEEVEPGVPGLARLRPPHAVHLRRHGLARQRPPRRVHLRLRRIARHDRRRRLPHQREIHPVEERVGLHLRGASPRPQPLLGVLDQQRRYEVPRRRVERATAGGRRERERGADDVAECGLVVGAGEGGAAVEQLVEEHAERPPVHRGAVGPPGGHLRRHVLVRAHERPRTRLHHEARRRRSRARGGSGLAATAPREREAVGARRVWLVVIEEEKRRRVGGGLEREVEVGEHDVPVIPDEHVLRLEVAVHDPEHVEVLEREEHLGGVEPGGGGGERASSGPRRHAVAERVEVPAGAELGDGAREPWPGVEAGVEGGEERVVEALQDAGLRRGAVELALRGGQAPVHHLHREEVVGGGEEAAEVDGADVAAADAADQLEVLWAERGGCF
ncbi:hypothetical protein QOZ80_5BG0446580 [Eleusine coracana subsp. coracana]|nr:hypothetical protein QOZ80_5BG0446580 [Eleusine coracana subsp. coracana]